MHKETHAPAPSYLIRFSVSPPFFAFSGYISYAILCFQGIHIKAIGFLNLVSNADLLILLKQQLLPMVQHHFLLFLHLSKAYFQYYFICSFFSSYESLSLLALIAFIQFQWTKAYTLKAYQTIQQLEPLPLILPSDMPYCKDSSTSIKDSEPPCSNLRYFSHIWKGLGHNSGFFLITVVMSPFPLPWIFAVAKLRNKMVA